MELEIKITLNVLLFYTKKTLNHHCAKLVPCRVC